MSLSSLKKKANTSKHLLPKVDIATSSKSANISTSLVNYDGSSTDTEA